jgi:hypothetical protein
MDWRDSKRLDFFKKTFRRVHFSNNDSKKTKIEKNHEKGYDGDKILAGWHIFSLAPDYESSRCCMYKIYSFYIVKY